MKLASLPQGRDGRLIVVSDDLAWYADADHIVPTMQRLLDEWDRYFPIIEALGIELSHGAIPRKRFHEREAAAPLPRAFQWVDGSAYVNHVDLVRKARGTELPQSFWTDPLMYQGGSDDLRAARDPLTLPDEAWGGDFEAEVVVVTGDVPQGVSPEAARAHIRLVGFVQSKPASHFSPVFVTPDALGDAWSEGKLHRPLMVDLNGQPFGRVEAGEDCTFDFGVLIAHLAKTRKLGAGSIVGSGTVSNRDADGGPGRPAAQGGRGYCCIAEQRTVEHIRDGAPATPFLRHGDTVRIEMRDAHGHSLFGAIEQTVVAG